MLFMNALNARITATLDREIFFGYSIFRSRCQFLKIDIGYIPCTSGSFFSIFVSKFLLRKKDCINKRQHTVLPFNKIIYCFF
ncbi:hypothetical protein AT239_04650 [Bartonella henselae]|nr:hypothetical protein AT240_07570 [Bartonella henselae]OLL56160.1 hypothetical protein AT239_04650 [Bartonella henselae]